MLLSAFIDYLEYVLSNMISYIPSSEAICVPTVGWAWVPTLKMGRIEDILSSKHCKANIITTRHGLARQYPKSYLSTFRSGRLLCCNFSSFKEDTYIYNNV